MKYKHKHPPYPSIFKIFIRDSQSFLASVVSFVFIFTALVMFFLTPLDQRFWGFWTMFNILFYPPLLFIIIFLMYYLPRRVQYIRQIWKSGDVTIATINQVKRAVTHKEPDYILYEYVYDLEKYEGVHSISRWWQPPATKQLTLIVNPQNPDEHFIISFY